MEWLIRMRDAIDAMETQLMEPFDIEAIAKVACSSTFHFQRMFHMLTGMTVSEYMRKRKLTLAAQELAMSSCKVVDVAFKYGYESPESFSKAFRRLHGVSPSEARDPGVQLKAYPRISFHLSLKGDKDMEYRILEKGSFTMVGTSIEVSCVDGENLRRIPAYWGECSQDGTIERLAALGSGNPLMGVCVAQPDKEKIQYWVAVESGSAEVPEGFAAGEVPAATWAVFTSVGPVVKSIQEVWCSIYQEWFPGTGYEHAAGPELEMYPPGDTNAEDYRCEVWIPIVKK
jgi:AraC family transcriptional regulator